MNTYISLQQWSIILYTVFHDLIFLRFNIQAEVKVTMKEHMSELLQAETRIILLYSTKV